MERSCMRVFIRRYVEADNLRELVCRYSCRLLFCFSLAYLVYTFLFHYFLLLVIFRDYVVVFFISFSISCLGGANCSYIQRFIFVFHILLFFFSFFLFISHLFRFSVSAAQVSAQSNRRRQKSAARLEARGQEPTARANKGQRATQKRA